MRVAPFCVLSLSLAACSSSDASITDASLADAAPDSALCTGARLESVSGRIVDEEGNGIERAFGQLCVKSQNTPEGSCLAPPPSLADGSFRVDLPPSEQCVLDARLRILAPTGARATGYFVIPLAQFTSANYTFPEPFVALALTAPTSLPTDLEPEVLRDVVLADGLVLSTRPADFFSASDYGLLASRRFDGEAIPSFLPERQSLTTVFALRELMPRPSGITFRVASALGLPAGTELELLVLGGLGTTNADGERIAEGEWELFGTARVNDDATALDAISAPMPTLTWLAIRQSN